MINNEYLTPLLTNIRKDLCSFSPQIIVTNNIVYERNDRYFNDNEIKNDLKSIPWENNLSQVNLSASLAFQTN